MKIITSTAVPLPIENTDTDQIIPSRFLKAITRVGFGKNLFCDWKKDPSFILNNTEYSGEILVAGRNFGCGSSREHAAWALVDYGFKVVISSFFADIFKSNALNNFLLPVQISDEELNEVFKIINSDPKAEFVVNLPNQTLQATNYQFQAWFNLDPYKKICLMEGYDDVEYLLSKKDKVETFEANRNNDFHVKR